MVFPFFGPTKTGVPSKQDGKMGSSGFLLGFYFGERALRNFALGRRLSFPQPAELRLRPALGVGAGGFLRLRLGLALGLHLSQPRRPKRPKRQPGIRHLPVLGRKIRRSPLGLCPKRQKRIARGWKVGFEELRRGGNPQVPCKGKWSKPGHLVRLLLDGRAARQANKKED